MEQEFFDNSITKMKHRIEEGDIKKAVYIADKIDWGEVKDINLLLYVAKLYEDYKDYSSAKALIEYSYALTPIKSKMYYALCNINIKLGDMKRAKEFYMDFVSVFPNDSKKMLLQYYFLKKKGADVIQKCRILEEYIEEEKDEDILFELAVLYEEMGETKKLIKTCEYIVEFFGVKKGGYGRKALELKRKYAKLTLKEEDLLENDIKENDEENKTNIVYQNISRPNLKVVKENDDEVIIEKIKKENQDDDNVQKDEKGFEMPVMKYEPEIIEKLRDVETTMAFMQKQKNKPIENKKQSNSFNKYRQKSFKRKDKNMKIEDLKQNMIIEAYSREEAYNIATEELLYLHRALRNEKKAAKVSAYNINERGFKYYIEKLGDRDLIIENAGQLKNQSIDEVEEFIIKNNKQNILVLCDIINNFDKTAENRPAFIDRFDVYSVLSEKKQDILDDSDIKKDFGLNIKNPKEVKVEIKTIKEEEKIENEKEILTDKPRVVLQEAPKEEVKENVKDEEITKEIKNNQEELENKENIRENIKKRKAKDMNVDEFVEFCKQYAKSIDCNMPGKTIPALYERIEMMTEEGLALTEKRAVDLIEQAADKAERPRLFSKPKYDKEGNLILQEEHFID